jgi:rod shape determining protein RodA
MLDKRLLVRMDFVLLACVLLLAAYGMVFIFSTTHLNRPDNPYYKVKQQAVWLLIGLAAMCVTTFADYGQFARFLWPLFIAVLAVLAGLVIAGHVLHVPIGVRDSVRWVHIGPVTLQPSEFVKVVLVALWASFFAEMRGRTDDIRALGISLAILAGPAALILLQPDLGTPIVLSGIWLVMAFAWGAHLLQLVAVGLTGGVSFLAAWEFGLLTAGQKARLLAFLDPAADPLRTGYHLAQSRAAVGAGGFLGQGYLNGSQTQLGFIPDQETDFIFTAIAEEAGFVGCIVLFGLFALLLWRCMSIAREAKDDFGRYIAIGLAGLLGLHIFVNIGMTMGLVPVKGLPLPFVSYGGSNMLTNMVALGLLQNIWMRRAKITF